MSKNIDDSNLSKVISSLRYPLVLAVIFVHASGISVEHLQEINTSAWTLFDSVRYVFSKIVCQTAVPTFFFISGYLFFYHISELSKSVYKEKIYRRIKTLVVPFVVWSLLALIVILALKMAGLALRHQSLDLGAVIKDNFANLDFWLAGPFNYHLWYLRELIIVTFLAPLWYLAIKYLKAFSLLLLLVFYLCDFRENTSLFGSLAMITFCSGAWFAINGINFASWFYKRRVIICSVCLLCFISCLLLFRSQTNMYMCAYKLFILTGIPAIIIGGLFISPTEKYLKFSQSSFFVYLSHVFILPITGALLVFLGDNYYVLGGGISCSAVCCWLYL